MTVKFKSSNFNFTDYLIALLAAGVTFLYCFIGIGELEYFRHTEADRTLIAWEMLKNNHWAIPHFLGDAYLTKPPIFYLLLAQILNIAGNPEIWAARSASAVSAAFLGGVQYLFCRSINFSKGTAIFNVIMLCSSAFFFRYSSIAEIDMTFALFCALTMFCSFHSILHALLGDSKNCRKLAMATSLFLSLAILTKGPQICAFLVFGFLSILVLKHDDIYHNKPNSYKILANSYLKASLIPILMVGIWIVAVAINTPIDDIIFRFKKEILERFVSDPKASYRSRSIFFYLYTLPTGFMPWTPFLLGIIGLLKGKDLENTSNIDEKSNFSIEKIFLKYSLTIIALSIFIFSLSSGKSSRYLFPIMPLVGAMCGVGLIRTLNSKSLTKISLLTLKVASALAFVSSLVICLYSLIYLSYISKSTILFSCLATCFTCGLSFYTVSHYLNGKSLNLKPIAFSICLIIISIRFPYNYILAKYKNNNYSVVPVVSKIADDIKATPDFKVESNLYVIEMFERWILYYLLTDHKIITKRLHPKLKFYDECKDCESHKINLLINKKDEYWRIEKLQEQDVEVDLVSEYDTARGKFTLVRIPANKANLIKTKKIFPTTPSKP